MKLRVAIVYGGRSGEHEVSIRSARSILAAIDRSRYEVSEYFIDLEGRWHPRPIVPQPGANPGIDVVFPVLHGTFGEDGTIQGLLELADLPYVGAGVLASAAGMDKEITKRLCRERGLPVVDFLVLRRPALDAERVLRSLPLPVFVKPANLGSSVGITKVKVPEQLPAALELAAQYDRKIIVERAIDAREIECSVLGNEEPQASLPCEIIPSREFYDYEDKYVLNRTQFRIPAELPGEMIERIRQMAVAAYEAVQCEGMARVDFLLDRQSGQLYVNELNTIPGFTEISMYPKMWEATGLSYRALIDRLIELALERHEARRRTRYRR